MESDEFFKRIVAEDTGPRDESLYLLRQVSMILSMVENLRFAQPELLREE